MVDDESRRRELTELRRRVAEALGAGQDAEPARAGDRELIHELRTHEIELEMQNEELRRMQTSLSESLERYSDLYLHAPVGYVTTSTSGVVLRANLAAAEMFSRGAAELSGEQLTLYIVEEDQDTYYLHRKTLIETRQRQGCQVRLGTGHGDPLIVKMESVLTRDPDGDDVEIRCALTDITRLQHVSENLEQANDCLQATLAELKEAQAQVLQQERLRTVGTMCSGIAHDFNNALTSILGYTELLLQPDQLRDLDKARDYLKIVQAQARDAAAVVGRMHQFYRRRDDSESVAPVNIVEICEQAVAFTRPAWHDEAQGRGVDIKLELEAAPVPPVYGNESELRQLLVNLILNAVDAYETPGTIRVGAQGDDEHVCLQVSDDGCGMSEETLARCLDPFFSTKGVEHAGLGLAGVHGAIARHEGTLDIASTPGQGTRVTIRLPFRPVVGEVPKARIIPAIRELQILVVDDEPGNLVVLSELLALDGHVVTTARSAAEALSLARGTGFDVVMTDRAMPGMSGEQLAAALKDDRPELQVILVTGFGEMMNATGDLPPAVDLVIGKPYSRQSIGEGLARLRLD